MRLFIAFPIPHEAAREVERVHHILEQQNSRVPITWTRTQPHCTLVFLGDCDDATIAFLKEQLPTFRGTDVILARLGPLDAFPNPHHPRVLIVRIEDLSGAIKRLYEQMISVVELDPGSEAGMTDKRSFTPHVTLGRVKQDGVHVQGLETPVQPVAFEVSEVVLFASELLPQGPRHTELSTVNL